MSTFSENEAHLTEKGSETSKFNILIGLALLTGFLASELGDLFFSNEYHFMDEMPTWRHVARAFLAWIVLIGQIVVSLAVTPVCVGSIITSSLDTTDTMDASIAAFFVMELDDKLVPILFGIVPYNYEGARCFNR